jgi:hypothetical protein
MKLISFIFALLAIFFLSTLNLNALHKFNKRYSKIAMNTDIETTEQAQEIVPASKEEMEAIETIPAEEKEVPDVAPAPMEEIEVTETIKPAEEIEEETIEKIPEVAPAPMKEMETLETEEEEIPESYSY